MVDGERFPGGSVPCPLFYGRGLAGPAAGHHAGSATAPVDRRQTDSCPKAGAELAADPACAGRTAGLAGPGGFGGNYPGLQTAAHDAGGDSEDARLR